MGGPHKKSFIDLPIDEMVIAFFQVIETLPVLAHWCTVVSVHFGRPGEQLGRRLVLEP